MYRVAINNNDYTAKSLKELENYLREDEASQYREIWIEHDVSKMCALVTGKEGWLMLLRFEGDVGFSSRNKTYKGSMDEMSNFKLSNGQIDEYPLSWSLAEDDWIMALLHFAETGHPIESVMWHDDS